MITYVSTDDFDFVNERRCAMQRHLQFPQSEIAGLGKIKKAIPSQRLTRFSQNSHQHTRFRVHTSEPSHVHRTMP